MYGRLCVKNVVCGCLVFFAVYLISCVGGVFGLESRTCPRGCSLLFVVDEERLAWFLCLGPILFLFGVGGGTDLGEGGRDAGRRVV